MELDRPSIRGSALRAGAWLVCLAGLAATTSTQAGIHLHSWIVVSPGRLDFYGPTLHRAIPMSHLRVAEARIVDLDQEPGLRPGFKIFGVGLPSYHLGWFLLRDRQKALVALSRSKVAVYVPSVRGPAVLVSPEDPVGFLDALRQPRHAGRTFSVENAQ